MPQNIFIYGDAKSGKTTLIKEIVAELQGKGLKVGGFISPEERHHGTRNAFHVVDVESGRQALLASVEGDGPKVSKYHVDIKSFESVAVPSMERFAEYDVFFIDEIGRMEMKSAKFSRLLDRIFESGTPLIATLHTDYVSRFAPLGEDFELSLANREAVFARVLRKAYAAFGKRKAPAAKTARPAVKTKAPSAKTAKKKAAKKPARKKIGRAAAKKKPKRKEPAKVEKAKRSASAPAKALKEKKKKGLLHHIKSLLHG